MHPGMPDGRYSQRHNISQTSGSWSLTSLFPHMLAWMMGSIVPYVWCSIHWQESDQSCPEHGQRCFNGKAGHESHQWASYGPPTGLPLAGNLVASTHWWLKLAPKVFTALADTSEYAKEWSGKGDHYLDDFITIGPPGSDEHQRNLDIMLDACSSLGVPLSKEKLEGSSSCIAFLGMRLIHVLESCNSQ